MKNGMARFVCGSFDISIGIAASLFAAVTTCHAGQKQLPHKNALPSPAAVKVAKKSASKAAAKATTPAALVYECPDCHDKFTLAQAKKAGLKCECCQTKLVSIKQPAKQSEAVAPQGKPVKKG